MSTLSSASTDQEVWNSWDDSSSYFEDGSVAKAKALVTAGIILLQRRPKRSTQSGRYDVEFDPSEIRRAIEAAQEWLAANDDDPTPVTSGVRHTSFRNFRT